MRTVPEMTFEHDYARSKSTLRVVYIEYHGRRPHSVIAEKNGFQYHFDFDYDCKKIERFMYYHSGSGGKITDIQPPHFCNEYTGGKYWMHPDAKFKGKAINAKRIEYPVKYNKDPNPFNNGREIYGQDYCKFCKKWYDQDACPDHHIVNDEGELQYFDDSNASD